MRPLRFTILAGALLVLAQGAPAQRLAGYTDAGETRSALARARQQAQAAAGRARRLEVDARSTRVAAEKTASQAAAIAARIQEAEAGIAAAQARIALARQGRASLDRRLAVRRGPLIRLTAGLQKLARRPLALSVLRPGSVKETVYLRAMLASTLPEVRRRTAALRGELARAQAIEAEAADALAAQRVSERLLGERRRQLAGIETRQRLASRAAGGAAAREAERALALAEEARDLDGLVGRLDDAGALRRELASLPGPRLRPPRPERSEVVERPGTAPTADSASATFQLPVTGRILTGFGASDDDGVRSAGLAIAPAAGALVVAPGAGRVAFAGLFRGFDRIVIVEHGGGFTSLLTGLARVDVRVGDALVAGSPLGVAGVGSPLVTLELRKDGVPVNPVGYLR